MKTKTRQLVRYLLKIPGIIRSQHDPFLPGNIAKGGVIETISRKAISPFDIQTESHVGNSPITGSRHHLLHRTGTLSSDLLSIVLSEKKSNEKGTPPALKRISKLLHSINCPKYHSSISEQQKSYGSSRYPALFSHYSLE